jgi:putative transposase
MVRGTARKTTKRHVRDDGWRLPDALWAKMEPLLPPRPPHPLGCHNPRVPDRAAMDAIFFVLRTGCQWNALRETTICSSSSAHRRFQEWVAAGVFAAFWREGLLAYDALRGIDWTWLALDGAMGKAPLGGGKNRPQPDGSRQARGEALGADRWPRRPARSDHRRGQSQRP